MQGADLDGARRTASFRTMIIAQITDTHLSHADAANPVFGARAENLRQCVADINGLDPMPDAVIHTGDMAQHGQAGEYVHARSLLAALEVPLYVTPGNR
ncbi:MAG: metallophosphoesterase, partial [Rhodospirillales bacterium]|nr:metallophosphoesterase [Rhodospirillales bacterium]